MKKVDLGILYEDVITALQSMHFSECHMATEEEDDQRTPRRDREMWTAGYVYSWRKMKQQQRPEMDKEEWSTFHWARTRFKSIICIG